MYHLKGSSGFHFFDWRLGFLWVFWVFSVGCGLGCVVQGIFVVSVNPVGWLFFQE